MSSPWGDDEDDDQQMSDQPASTTPITTTTTTTTSIAPTTPTSPQPKSSVTSQLLGLTGRANSIEHVPKIQADTDYLYRLIRQQDQSDEFGAAINAWSTVYPGVKLLLPDGCINPAVFSNGATLPEGTIPIIETAVNVGNSRALMAIIKWYLDHNQPMQTSIVLSLLTTKQSEDVLNLFFAHSERFIQTNLTGNDLLQCRIEPIQFQTPQRTKNITKCEELIGTHNASFDTFLDSYIQQYKLPPFNSCGYILNGIVALYAPKAATTTTTTTTTTSTTMTDNTNQEQCTLQFTYKNNQSLFRYALECNNLTAFSKLLNHVSKAFPQSTLVPALFDILSLETRLELVPSMVARIISGIKTSTQRQLILEQLLSHPITHQSIYDILFEKILNLQVLHAEYEADQLLNKGANNTTPSQQNPTQLLPTSPQIFHAFTQLLQAVVCINHLVLEAQSGKDDNRRSALLAAYSNGLKTDPASTTPITPTPQPTQITLSGSIDSPSYQLNQKMVTMCTSFSKSLIALLKQTTGSTIFQNVKVNLVQEFTLSTFIQFIPYFTPQGLIMSLAMIPEEFHTTLNELLPKLPIIYFRPINNATPFHVHKALYDYRTRPQPSPQQQQQGQPPQQPPQILTSTHLRLPSYLTILNNANSPTNPDQAAALYRVHNWDNVAIKTFQEARLSLYNTQLKPNERKQVHPILLLKFHPITIIQALYLCLDEPPGVGLIDNAVFALLLQQLASTPVSSADEVIHHSIISRRDSPKIKKLIDSKAFIPTQILPILTPTVTDFAYACISRPQPKTPTAQSKSEHAYYIAYFFDLVTTLKLLPTKDYTTFLQTITKNQYDSIVAVRDAINGWLPTGIGQGKNQINTGIRLLTTAFMSHQSDASIQRLMTNFDQTLSQHTTYATQSLIVDNNDEPVSAMNSSTQRFIPPDFSTDRFTSSSINGLLSKLGSLAVVPPPKQ